MSWHILPAKLIKFAMSVRSRKLVPIIRHCWAVRMMICLIKSNTDQQQCPLTLLTNIRSKIPYKHWIISTNPCFSTPGFRLARVNYCAAGWPVGSEFPFTCPAASGAKMARVSHGALGVGHWGTLTRESVHNLWRDAGQFILEKNQDIIARIY